MHTEYKKFHLELEEPHAIELEKDRILGAIRWQGVNETVRHSIHLTLSDDGGKTWSAMYPTDISGSDNTPPHLLKHSSGALIMTFGRRDFPFGERAAVSYDNGKT